MLNAPKMPTRVLGALLPLFSVSNTTEREELFQKNRWFRTKRIEQRTKGRN